MTSSTTILVTNPVSKASARPEPERSSSIAKITHPKTTGVFPRKRLFRILDECRESPVVWVSAPAGSGKTTLVASYLSERKLQSIWYRVDEGDGDIATFFYYMGLAAKKATPRTMKHLPLFTPEYLLGIKTFTLRYFENLYRRLTPPSVIVFDNYQHVQAQSQFHEVICNGLDLLPETINAIIISREGPPPQFARLRVSGKIHLLQGEDIRFNLDETKEMIRLKGVQDISDSSVHRIHERTLGWAAGLALMTENSTGKGFIDKTLSGHAPQEIFDYFATEIFAGR
jgi:ATP/maltotriose-dependent transcriptional regulator MalT